MTPPEDPTRFPDSWDPRWIAQRSRVEAGRLPLRPADGGAAAAPRGPYRLLRWGLKASGFYQHGYRNFLDLRLTRLSHRIPGWPPALDGFRILQLSDLHIDLDPALVPVICARVREIRYEMAVFTGDFHDIACHREQTRQAAMARILEAVGRPSRGVYGVLGNHDSLAVGASLARQGIHLLNNDSVIIGEGNSRFLLAGVDDAYFFKTHDIPRAMGSPTTRLPRILLSHSPQIAPEAAAAGADLMLSGHTHGGQICLPGGRSLITMPEIPTKLFRGPWKIRSLRGYTSTGTGSCHLPIRFHCPPEVVLHSLHPSA